MVTIRLDGRLAGPEARELAESWRASPLNPRHRHILIDLAGVTAVDRLGRDFLAQIYLHGGTLIAGNATAAVVDEILGLPARA